jgi:hypothetical protein
MCRKQDGLANLKGQFSKESNGVFFPGLGRTKKIEYLAILPKNFILRIKRMRLTTKKHEQLPYLC